MDQINLKNAIYDEISQSNLSSNLFKKLFNLNDFKSLKILRNFKILR